jgi:hypothetical protein
MHDPNVVAFEIPNPFVWGRRYDGKLRPTTLVTIWHHDPERDGSDDSCGWSYPNLSERQRKLIDGLAWSEAREPWFMRRREKSNERPVEAELLIRGALAIVNDVLGIGVSFPDVCKLAIRLTQGSRLGDNFRSAICHLPGYHTNSADDSEGRRRECAGGLFSGLAHHLLGHRRPWYRHPRWHLHHWRLQVHAVLRFKRWAFSRCISCGGRFPWGYAPVVSWANDGPTWFRNGEKAWHHECHDRDVGAAQSRARVEA